VGEPSAGAAHQENQDHEGRARRYDGESHAELRPFELLLARQGGQLTTEHHSKRRQISGFEIFLRPYSADFAPKRRLPPLRIRCEEWEPWLRTLPVESPVQIADLPI